MLLAASIKALVPELAIVPSVSTISSADRPMPLSDKVMVLSFLLTAMVILPSKVSAALPAVIMSNLRLLIASEAFEISSRRKISFCE